MIPRQLQSSGTLRGFLDKSRNYNFVNMARGIQCKKIVESCNKNYTRFKSLITAYWYFMTNLIFYYHFIACAEAFMSKKVGNEGKRCSFFSDFFLGLPLWGKKQNQRVLGYKRQRVILNRIY